MAERKVIAPQLVKDTDPSLDKSADLLARIVAQQLGKLERSADAFGVLENVDLEALKAMGTLLASMKRMKPDGVPMAVLRRAGLTGAQLEEITRLMEAEERQG